MVNLSPFCTCTNLKCKLHPTNHDKGCAPCLEHNVSINKMPRCFFAKLLSVKEAAELDSYSFEDFAALVQEQAANTNK